jgi:hypothetical protein
MSDTVTEQRFLRIESSESAPAVWQDGWLPDGEFFPELTEARDDYLRLRAAWHSASARASELREKIEADEAQRKQALRDAFLESVTDQQLEPADVTLQSQLTAAVEQSKAASEAYVEHINRCIALVLDHRQEWLGEITAFEGSLDAEVQALVDQAATLRAKRGHYGRLEHWIQRVTDGASFPPAHFPYANIPAPPSGDAAEEEARLRKFMLASYAGGIAPDQPASEEQGRELERTNEASASQSPVEPEERQPDEDEHQPVELNDLEADELVDWLTGTGMFDGQQKPSTALVVKAAEGDAEMAERLLQAERTARVDPRPEVLEALTEITNGKATA